MLYFALLSGLFGLIDAESELLELAAVVSDHCKHLCLYLRPFRERILFGIDKLKGVHSLPFLELNRVNRLKLTIIYLDGEQEVHIVLRTVYQQH